MGTSQAFMMIETMDVEGFLTLLSISSLMFTFLGSIVLAFFLSILMSKRFENRKLAAAMVVWTLLLPLFFIIGLAGFSFSLEYREALSRHLSFHFDPLNTFSEILKGLFFDGLNLFNTVLGVFWGFGLIIFVSKEKKGPNRADTMT